MMPERTLKVGEVAKHLNVDPNTVRNWCKWYPEQFSPGANPPRGKVRALTMRDQNVLRFIQVALNEGMNHAELSAELARKSFSNDDVDIIVGLTEIVQEPEQIAQDARSEAALLPVTLSGFRAEINALRAEIQLVRREQHQLLEEAREDGWHRGAITTMLLGSLVLLVMWLLVSSNFL